MKLPGFVPIGGESLYSLVARHFWLSGHYSYTDYLHALFGSRKARIHPYLPSGIEAVAATLEQPPDELLYHHTLFPLFAMCLDQPTSLRSAMLTLKGNAVMSAHLPHFKLHFFIGHKYCPVCVQRDIQKVGCGIWYIGHQIPGVSACAVHGCHLNGISNQDTAIDRHLSLPESCGVIAKASGAAIKFARHASSVLQLLAYQKNLSVNPIYVIPKNVVRTWPNDENRPPVS